MKHHMTTKPARLFIATASATAALMLISGCSSLDSALSGDTLDYRGSAVKGKSLEVPPDLTQLARDSRYQPQSGVVSAAAAASAPSAVPAAGGATGAPGATAVATPSDTGGMRVERQGQVRWLVSPMTPEALWPQLRAFWEQRGFTLLTDDPKIGVLETNWAENRAKLPSDVVRNTVGKLLGNLYDTGERDQFRMRVERTATGSEVYIAHRGAQEVFVGERRENTTWKARASDPQLEAEMLSRVMVALGAKNEPARALVAAAATAPDAPGTPAAPRMVATGNSIEVNDPFDRAWRRVGLALDRGGFTVEDRDRTLGVYYVRYVDPRNIGKEEPGWWARLFGDTNNPQAAVRYRIAVKGSGDKTTVAVLTSAGATDVGENGLRIASLLANELR